MSTQSAVDPGLVRETQLQIRSLLSELAELARSDIERSEFYREALERLVMSLAAVGGVIWTLNDRGELQAETQINLPQTALPDRAELLQAHTQLLSRALDSPRGLIVPPHAAATDEQQAANPTGNLLLLAPLVSDERKYGVVEVFQRPGAGAVTQRGYLRFVLDVCELASDYLKRQELRQYAGRQALWGRLEEFCRAVHVGLDVRHTARIVANEGNRLVGSDRLSVAVARGRGPRITAISGQDTFDRRATAVKLLDRLVRAVCAGGEPVWYTGDTHDLPPQIESALENYVDQTEHAKAVAVLPLFEPPADGQSEPTDADRKAGRRPRKKVVGALVVEQFQQGRLPEAMQERLQVVQEHASLALSNALAHDGLFLMPLWRLLGRCRVVTAARGLSALAATLVVVAGLVAALFLVPADFNLEARGTLQPEVRRDVFVREAGIVSALLVGDGLRVHAGDPLVQLRNRDLEVNLTDVAGRMTAMDEQIKSFRRARNESRLSFDEQSRLAGQLQESEKSYESLTRQLDLLKKKQEQLRLTSPIDGQVTTWDVKNKLMERWVEKGQVLMTVANTDKQWELELHVREDRMGHVARAWQAAKAAGVELPVDFILSSEPGQRHTGTVRQIDTIAEVREGEGNTVLVRVAIDGPALDTAEIRPGAGVSAKIHCGRRNLGYVWFHELIAAVESRLLF